MQLKFLNDADFKGKRVLARFDFNVPLAKDGSRKITDTSRIDRALPSIKAILEGGAKQLILMSHLGRPKGKINKDFSLEPVAIYLAEVLSTEVVLAEAAVDAGVKPYLEINKSPIVLLENLRFHEGETSNDREFAGKLSEYADIYVNDAFGAAHRKHASVHQINSFFKGKAYAGFLMEKEIKALNQILKQPKKPFVAIIGGAKVSDKIQTIEKLITSVSNLIIGGAMAYPFLKAQGHQVGKISLL
jgi:phosphoglycerate kinase